MANYFDTYAEAADAGYITLAEVRMMISGCGLHLQDTSGQPYYGYSYAVIPTRTLHVMRDDGGTTKPAFTCTEYDDITLLAVSHDVYLRQVNNQIGQPGAVEVMFLRDEVQGAIGRRTDGSYVEDRYVVDRDDSEQQRAEVSL